MTVTATIRRVWPGPKRTEIIIRIPKAAHPYYIDENGCFAMDAQRMQYTWLERQCYVWNSAVKGQLIASLCERAQAADRQVTLEYEYGDYGWLILSAQLADEEASA